MIKIFARIILSVIILRGCVDLYRIDVNGSQGIRQVSFSTTSFYFLLVFDQDFINDQMIGEQNFQIFVV